MKQIPVIDLFAGPGGLCEGFSHAQDGKHPFRPVLSIEMDATARETLKLRAFVHWFMFQSKDETLPEEYYAFLRNEIGIEELYNACPEAAAYAEKTAWCATLGGKDTPESEFDRRIREALGGEEDWILIGGPPCQAYSLAGRSRMLGWYQKGRLHYSPEEALKAFDKDTKQTLYKQYLRILARHRPAVFVMENVAGILSAKVHGERIFPKIVSDLSHPVEAALADWPNLKENKQLSYRIFSFTTGKPFDGGNFDDFLIRAERHGIPQARHRVILLGIRDDFRPELRTVPPLRPSDGTSVRKAIGDLPRLRSRISKGAVDSDAEWCRLLEFFGRLPAFEGFPAIRKKLDGGAAKRARWLPPDCNGQWQAGKNLPKALKQWITDDRISAPLQHASRSHMAMDLARYLFVAAFGAVNGRSPVLDDFPATLLPQHKNVHVAGEKGNQAFADRFKVQLEEKPSSTVTCHISKDGHHFIHYDVSQCRSLTVREAARLQTFPDNYFFMGNQTAQYHQVGNAVPPFLAYQLARIVHGLFLGGPKARPPAP